ncbi:tumor necrosis factor ligand superfamily member 13B isoform X2 [Hyaena hyaena]|uniref:tumor necrosis factor ligand superfamily member 13B isoform X2 n=1 Tax=Hyaena hyaena TaxID=95912 RepID=UPI001924BA4A|nr:tumor necrosis factor ligand superfamily member 13B isoform X2 [Hyaena hyaena]
MEGPVPGRPIIRRGPGCSGADGRRLRGALRSAGAQPGRGVGVGPRRAQLTGNDPLPAAADSKGPDPRTPTSAMDGGADGERSRLRPRPESGAEMRAKERVSAAPHAGGPPGRLCGDGALLAASLLLALASCCLSAASLCRAAALQAELGGLRAQLRAEPGAPRAGAPAPGEPAAPSALQGIFAPAAAGGSRRKRASLGPEETVIQDCLQLIADSATPTIREGSYTFVPWLLSFKRGRALEEKENKILVKETGYFFIYGQASQSWKKEMNSNWQYHVKMLKYHETEMARFSEH